MLEDIQNRLTSLVEELFTQGASRHAIAMALLGAGSGLLFPVDSREEDNDELVDTYLKVRIAFPLVTHQR